MSFTHIKGHKEQIEIINGWLKQAGALAGRGYLFSGPEGIGKKLVAETLAKALNCDNGTIDSCDKCPSCLKIDKRQHPDVHFIPTSQERSSSGCHRIKESLGYSIDDSQTGSIKIEDIRQLKRNIALRPYEARYKVFIIDNAHNITAEAANALLKTLEEPAENSLIILISSKGSLLLKTIVSRCRILRFYPIQRVSLKIILKEDYALNDTTAHFLSFFAEGRLGFALNLKGKDILSKKNKIIDMFGLQKILQPFGIQDGQPGKTLRPVNLDKSFVGDREQMRDILTILSVWFRDIYMLKALSGHSELINIDRKDEVWELSRLYSYEALDKIFNFISSSMLWVEQNINNKLLLSNLKYVLKET